MLVGLLLGPETCQRTMSYLPTLPNLAFSLLSHALLHPHSNTVHIALLTYVQIILSGHIWYTNRLDSATRVFPHLI
jgi:hypothetical protein